MGLGVIYCWEEDSEDVEAECRGQIAVEQRVQRPERAAAGAEHGELPARRLTSGR